MKYLNLYKIRKWYLFYSSQIDFLYQAGTKLLQYYRRFAYFLIFLLKRFELYGWNCPIRP